MITAFEVYQDLKTVDHERKVINAKYDNLKKTAIQKFLVKKDEVIGPEGLVLFTYKLIESTQFQIQKFKEENPDIYNLYLQKQEQRRFLLK